VRSEARVGGVRVFKVLLVISLLEALLWSTCWVGLFSAGVGPAVTPGSDTYFLRETGLFKTTDCNRDYTSRLAKQLDDFLDQLHLSEDLHLHEETESLIRLQEAYLEAQAAASNQYVLRDSPGLSVGDTLKGLPGPFLGVQAFH